MYQYRRFIQFLQISGISVAWSCLIIQVNLYVHSRCFHSFFTVSGCINNIYIGSISHLYDLTLYWSFSWLPRVHGIERKKLLFTCIGAGQLFWLVFFSVKQLLLRECKLSWSSFLVFLGIKDTASLYMYFEVVT